MATNYELGPFRLDGKAEILFRGSEPVALGQRAVALLCVLVERAGAPVSKNALIETAWPGLAVEDANLTVQIAALRRVFAEEAGNEGWIETLPRRGYRYVGPVVATNLADMVVASTAPANMPLVPPDKPSIAVLPFHGLSSDPEQEYFGDGVVEDIIMGLARIKWMFVIARNSSFTYKGRAVDVKQVGRELGVRYVLEGSVRKAGTRLRLTAQLVEAATGRNLWAERYDRNLDDVFAVQDEITLAVVGAIEPSLRAAEIEHVKRKRPESLDAYDLVLRALPEIYTAMPTGAEKVLALTERALVLEPNYALAHGLASWAHQILFVRAGMHDENRHGAIEHGHAAINHGRSDPMALAFAALSLALIEHDRVVPFDAFEQAVRISPSFAPAYMLASPPWAYAGHAERAVDWGERAVRLSPFDPFIFGAHQGICIGNFILGRHDEAARAGRKAVNSNPEFSFSHVLLAAPLARLGRMEEAKAAIVRACERQPDFSINRQCAAVGIIPEVAKPLIDALREAGLPD